MNILYLKQNERIQDGVLLRPMEQPPEGYTLNKILNEHAHFYCIEAPGYTQHIKLTHPSGKYTIDGADIVVGVETTVKRIQDLSTDELIRMGLISKYDDCYPTREDSRNYHNSLYAHPVKNKAGDGYVCYPYDMPSWLDLYKNNKHVKLGQQPIANVTYKGLPLVIKTNPFFQILKCKKGVRNN